MLNGLLYLKSSHTYPFVVEEYTLFKVCEPAVSGI